MTQQTCEVAKWGKWGDPCGKPAERYETIPTPGYIDAYGWYCDEHGRQLGGRWIRSEELHSGWKQLLTGQEP